MINNLSHRLYSIAKCFDANDLVADIGADHGKLIIYLGNKYKNNKYLAVENKKGPFDNLTSNITKYSVNNNILASFSFGIENINDSINTLLFAGLGGYTVIEIIQRNFNKIKNINKIVLCVNNGIVDILKFLSLHNFYVNKSSSVEEDGQIYLIFALVKHKNQYLEADINNYVKNCIDSALKNGHLIKKYKNKLMFECKKEENAIYLYNFKEYSDKYVRNRMILGK